MKEKIIHVLCEGQTEQSFVEAVLKPYLMDCGVKAVKTVPGKAFYNRCACLRHG